MLSIRNDFIEPFMVIRQTLAPLKLSRWQCTKLLLGTFVRSLSGGAIAVLAALLLILYQLFRSLNRRLRLPTELPVLKTNASHFEDILKEARVKYPNSPVLVKNNRHAFVIYPGQCFDELKRLPEHTASAKGFFHAANYGDWSLIGRETSTLLKGIMADLTRSLPARVFSRQQDCRMAFDSTIGYCPEWKEFNLLFTTFDLVAQINACSFVGRELGCNRKWVRGVMMSPIIIHVAVTMMDSLPILLRPLLVPLIFLPALKNQWDMKRLLVPYLKEDIKTFNEAVDKKELLKPKSEGKIPFTAILLSRYKAAEATIRQLVEDYVLISFDSTPSTTSALYHVICELVKNPEAADILRRELNEVIVDGKLPSSHLQELKRMDSFLRESFRLHPVSLFSLQRYLEKPVKLSVGPTIPAGAIIGLDAQAINRSPELWQDPEKFDMDRFYNLRNQPGNESRYHFLTTGSDSPGWGDGTQACPGRFFATSTIKIAFAHILLNYDIEFKEGSLPIKITPLANGTWKPDDTLVACFKSRT
ncbi:putative cytochrome p450 oxidoreductase [Venustampulla echinocandica]|uniref:Putative cytochrome p450 oxidoreductase n=1 Tax=Venustampulla echinocandica TaxID=2656787 RepID=A0A370TEX3_9HELO|nr:putative cytochrome p450 oxidoreductase [Venustampulla echinocandica]RDL33243.1 putative cytochrome p450 oxidoreductase [Venustampulla echinocandica]